MVTALPLQLQQPVLVAHDPIEPLPTGGYAKAYFGLMEALEALFQRPVDLVVDSAIRNPYFRESVERSKVRLYGA